MYVRRVKRRTYIVSPQGQSLLCVPCALWFKKGNKSTKSTMSLRSRFIGAMRREQNSPMDMLLKRPARQPRRELKKPIVFRSIGVMQRSQYIPTNKGQGFFSPCHIILVLIPFLLIVLRYKQKISHEAIHHIIGNTISSCY